MQAEGKGATGRGRKWGEKVWKILMEVEAVLHVLPPGERHFGSSYGRSKKLKACHSQHEMRIFLGVLFPINEFPRRGGSLVTSPELCCSL
jgi:hypothetical protein